MFLLWNRHKLVSRTIKTKSLWREPDVLCFHRHKLKALTWILCMIAAVFMINLPSVTAGAPNPPEQHSNGECKRQELEAPSNQATSASHLDLNFPLPGEKGPSCLVKVPDWSSYLCCHVLNGVFRGLTEVCRLQVYEDWESFKVNDALEVYGILSVSPALSALADEK